MINRANGILGSEMAFDVVTMNSSSDARGGDLGREGETGRWCECILRLEVFPASKFAETCTIPAPDQSECAPKSFPIMLKNFCLLTFCR